MSNNLERIKKSLDLLKNWKKEKQSIYLDEALNDYWEEINNFSKEEKYELLRHSMLLNKKSHVNIIAQKIDINLNSKELKLWKNLENCDDKSWLMQLIKKQDNWLEFDNEYFFEQALKSTRGFYINKTEQKTLKNFLEVFKEKLNVEFFLRKEEKTGLSNWSYFINKNAIWGDCLNNVLNIRPGWLEKDFYNVISGGNSEIDESKVDWNRIEKKLESYSEEAKNVVRKILDLTVFQKIGNSYVIEKKDIPISFIADLWLLKKEHFDLDIIYPEEKLKLLEKTINHNSSPVLIKSANKEGLFLQTVLNSCLDDERIDWQKIELNKDAWRALELIILDKIVKNNQLKSKLEENLFDKVREKKHKI